mmetsp:Transcript_5970/g.17456  ORF Transcript_5970/g.17456 Transcript_5970/m.17456 type:complete len:245 (+) Transcript_5970:223-957(+)
MPRLTARSVSRRPRAEENLQCGGYGPTAPVAHSAGDQVVRTDGAREDLPISNIADDSVPLEAHADLIPTITDGHTRPLRSLEEQHVQGSVVLGHIYAPHVVVRTVRCPAEALDRHETVELWQEILGNLAAVSVCRHHVDVDRLPSLTPCKALVSASSHRSPHHGGVERAGDDSRALAEVPEGPGNGRSTRRAIRLTGPSRRDVEARDDPNSIRSRKCLYARQQRPGAHQCRRVPPPSIHRHHLL